MARGGIIGAVLVAAAVVAVTQLPDTGAGSATLTPPVKTYDVEPGHEWIVVGVDTVADEVACADATKPRGTVPGSIVHVPGDVADDLAVRLRAYTAGQFSNPPVCPPEQG